LILPTDLTARQKRALRLIHDVRLYRRQSGHYGRTPAMVTSDMVNHLRGLGLVRIDYTARQPRPELTGAGRNLHTIMETREQMRGQA